MASAFCQTPLRPRCELGRRQPRAQLQVVSALHIRNPYKLLGLEDNADLKDVKRAYRKLALQLHPDVSKEENAHVKFLTITEAYELLVGRARGKEDTDHSNSNSWDFHDWYWNFRINRSWEKQQQSGSAHKPHSPGYQAPESKENVQSQLAGLRHRAAVRAQRNVQQQQQQEAQQQQHTPLNADPLHHSQWRPAYTSSASSQSQAHSTMVDGRYGTVLGNNAVPFPTTHSTASCHHSEHSDTPAHSTAAPFPAGLHAQGLSTVGEVHSEHRYAPVDEFGEPVSPFSAPKRRPAFAAGSDARHGVSSQLQGLRRKATLKTATACGSA